MAFKLKNKLGIWGERLAEQEYLKRGFVLVARNIYNTRGKMLGEIDLVMRSHQSIVFIEVKVRRGGKFGSAKESITKQTRAKLIRTVHWFLRRFPDYATLRPRIDVFAVDLAADAVTAGIDKQAINVIIIPSAVTLDY